MADLRILFEDPWILVIDKSAGIVVNRAETIKGETVQDQISEYLKLKDLGIGGRSGIVHRLDKETSGLLLAAKTEESYLNLQGQFKTRTIKKKYTALVHGFIKQDGGEIESKIVRIGKFGKFGIAKRGERGAREAKTEYKVTKRLVLTEKKFEELADKNWTKARINYLKKQARQYTLLDVYPKTGRTHQIRVHFKSINCPVVSDLIYAPKKLLGFDLLWCPRLFLHAEQLEFAHPASNKKIAFTLPLSEELKKALEQLTPRAIDLAP